MIILNEPQLDCIRKLFELNIGHHKQQYKLAKSAGNKNEEFYHLGHQDALEIAQGQMEKVFEASKV